MVQLQTAAAGHPNRSKRYSRRFGGLEKLFAVSRAHRQQVTTLVLSEKGTKRRGTARQLHHGTDTRSHRHLGKGNREPAIGEIVRGRHSSSADAGAHEIADALLMGEVDRRRGAFFAAKELAEIDRLAEMAAPVGRGAGKEDRFALCLEGKRSELADVVEESDAADRRGRRDRGAVGLVVERDIS